MDHTLSSRHALAGYPATYRPTPSITSSQSSTSRFCRRDHDVVNADRPVRRDLVGQHTAVPAVPLDAQRNREVRSRTLRTQPFDHRPRRLRRVARAMPAIGDARGALQRRLLIGGEPQRNRLRDQRTHRHRLDLGGNVVRLKRHRVLRPYRAHHRDALVHAPAALLERHAERGELLLQPADAGAQDQPPVRTGPAASPAPSPTAADGASAAPARWCPAGCVPSPPPPSSASPPDRRIAASAGRLHAER